MKNSDIFPISAQNIDCGYSLEQPRRGGSNEYTHSMFLSRNKKNNIYPCKPQFYYIKVGFEGVKIIYWRVFVMIGNERVNKIIYIRVRSVEMSIVFAMNSLSIVLHSSASTALHT